MPEGMKEHGGPAGPAEGGRNIRKVALKSTPDGAIAGPICDPYKRPPGEVPEWSIGTVSKTVVRASVPWVRIPPSPPLTCVKCR